MPKRELFVRSGLAAAGSVVQHQKLCYRRLEIQQPMIVLVRSGTKTVRYAGCEHNVPAGSVLAIAGGQVLDVINEPSGSADYHGQWITFEPDVIARFSAHGEPQHVFEHTKTFRAGEPFQTGIAAVSRAVADRGMPDLVLEMKLFELLAWLAHHGIRFRSDGCESLLLRVRKMIAADPAFGWNVSEAARRLHMSEATLRRHLAAAQTGFREQLTEARMTYALTLLQVTELPVSRIAYMAGYESPSRFTARFRQRFGFLPSAVRSRGGEP